MGCVLPAEGKDFEFSVPILVIGAGACGCTAALAAHERGTEVVILERSETPRGNTSLSGGQIPAGGTKLQKLAGINDSADILYRDILAKADNLCDKDLVRHVADESAKTVDWLVERWQLPLSCITNFIYPGHSVPHMHASPSRFGAELLNVLLQALASESIQIITSAKVTDLYVDKESKIRGVSMNRPDGKKEVIGCEALILACNGYGANKKLLEKYIPEIVNAHYHGHDGNQGDAIIWGESLGASIKDMGAFQGHGAVITPHNIHIGWPAITEGGIQVNKNGLRFSNENQGYSEQALNVVRQIDHVAWTVWDQRCENVATQMHSHQEATKANAIKKFNNVTELAGYIGCNTEKLQETLHSVERYCLGDLQDNFGRDFKKNPPLEPPYYIAKIQGALFHTQGGLEVDRRARVLRENGQPFPNLFAGGGAARGFSGPADWGYLSGSGLLSATNLGRFAGESAADLVLKKFGK